MAYKPFDKGIEYAFSLEMLCNANGKGTTNICKIHLLYSQMGYLIAFIIIIRS